MKRIAALGLVWCLPSIGAAQVLHVYGPPGDGATRHVVLVLETADGGCVPARSLTVVSDPGVEVILGDALGDCARSVELHALTGLAVLRSSEPSASVGVSLGAVEPVPLTVVRGEGGRLEVTPAGIVGAIEGQVFVDGSHTPLEPIDGVLVGAAPPDRLGAVLVRTSERFGVAALPGPGTGHPEVLLLPLELAPGAMPRPAAILVVVDDAGRPSRRVPLQVTSEIARLERLTWVEPGVAEVWLAAPPGSTEVDLSVAAGAAATSARLPVGEGVPVQGTIEATADDDGARIAATATGIDGAPVPPERLALRCGGAVVALDPGGQAHCALPPGAHALTLLAIVDGHLVPIAAAGFERAAPIERVAEVEPPPLPPPPAAPLWLALHLGGAVDGWARGAIWAGAGLTIEVHPLLSVEVSLRYAATFLVAEGNGVVAERLSGTEHATELSGSLHVAPLPPFFDVFVGPTLAIAVTDAVRRGSSALPLAWTEARAGGVVGVAGWWPLDGVRVGASLWARLSGPLGDVPFAAPIVRVGLDLTGAIDVR